VIKSVILFIERFVAIPDLGLRLWVAWVFFKSGLTKVTGFPPEVTSTTIFLFEHEYKVPLLPPEIAAWTGSYTELVIPIFLALDLGGRWAAGILFVFNAIAAISYPGLNPAGLAQHQLWGLILLYLFMRGPGRLSIDHFIRWRYMPDHVPSP